MGGDSIENLCCCLASAGLQEWMFGDVSVQRWPINPCFTIAKNGGQFVRGNCVGHTVETVIWKNGKVDCATAVNIKSRQRKNSCNSATPLR